VKSFPFTKGLLQVSDSIYAYLQPNGSWGWNNAGIVCDSGEAVLIDTLYDLKLTQEMLDKMRGADTAAENITYIVNTHANGDHTYGNQLIEDAQIISSATSADEMNELPPEMMAQLIANADAMGPVGAYIKSFFSPFNFEGIKLTPPTTTFEGETSIYAGTKEIILKDLGPAHTKSDVIAYIPEDKILFAGDLFFNEGTPVMWAGPAQNWINACDTIMSMEVDYIIPGHGAICEKNAILKMKGYLEYVYAQAEKCYDRGMSEVEAANNIPLKHFAEWTDPERIVINIYTMYQEFSKMPHGLSAVQLFGSMAQYM